MYSASDKTTVNHHNTFIPLHQNHLHYEEKDMAEHVEKTMKPRKNARISFYMNGTPQGVSFEDIYEGTYYPAASLYKVSKCLLIFWRIDVSGLLRYWWKD